MRRKKKRVLVAPIQAAYRALTTTVHQNELDSFTVIFVQRELVSFTATSGAVTSSTLL